MIFAARMDLFVSSWLTKDVLTFVSYLFLFVGQGILVTLSKTSDNKYEYNTVAAVLSIEILKLIISASIYLQNSSFHQFIKHFFDNYRILSFYLIPSAIYCLYNNLAFLNLAVFDPTTYFLLLQLRVVITGITYQFLFKRRLSKLQWASIILLTIGCIIKNVGLVSISVEKLPPLNLILIILQVLCSCFAGVYNEYLLKKKGSNVHIMMQNVFMYIDSILCNIIALLISPLGKLTFDSFFALFDPSVMMLMLNNALCGIVTSLFLKNLDSIKKTFASALELVFTAILCWIIFGFPIDIYTIISIFIVVSSTYMYFKNPLNTKEEIIYDKVPHNEHIQQA